MERQCYGDDWKYILMADGGPYVTVGLASEKLKWLVNKWD